MVPVASIIVPTIGRLQFIDDTMQSVARQEFDEPLEVLVLDNESPPEAQRVFARWAASDPRIKILRTSPRIPMYTNFNRGIAAARAEFITFFHDDDIYGPHHLRRSVAALREHPTAVFCGSNADFVDDQGTVIERRRWIQRSELVSGRKYIERLLSRGRTMTTMPGIVYRRGAIARGFDDSL